jgi:hypothetical protein
MVSGFDFPLNQSVEISPKRFQKPLTYEPYLGIHGDGGSLKNVVTIIQEGCCNFHLYPSRYYAHNIYMKILVFVCMYIYIVVTDIYNYT